MQDGSDNFPSLFVQFFKHFYYENFIIPVKTVYFFILKPSKQSCFNNHN